MAAVATQGVAVQNAHCAESESHQWQLKHNAHHQEHTHESVHIGVERDLVGNHRAHLIVGEEAERHGEHYEVAHSHAEEEHQRAEDESHTHSASLVVVESRADKGPQQIDKHRESEYQCQPERGGHVNEELRSQLNVDELHRKAFGGELRQSGELCGQPFKKAVESEVAATGGENNAVE